MSVYPPHEPPEITDEELEELLAEAGRDADRFVKQLEEEDE